MRPHDRYAGSGAAVLESRRASVLHSFDYSAAWTICMERAPLEPLLAGIHEPLQRCLAGRQSGAASAGALSRDAVLARSGVRPRAHQHAHQRSRAERARRERATSRPWCASAACARRVCRRCSRSWRATRAEPGLDPAAFAARMGLSVRYLHRLLEPTGRSFAEHLLAKRLERAAGMLRDPAFADCGSARSRRRRASATSRISTGASAAPSATRPTASACGRRAAP